MSISKSKSENYHHGDLRNALIEAGVELLKDEGMSALSLRKLARHVGVSHNAPYMHFKDKEALLAAISEQGFVILAERIESVIAESDADWFATFQRGCQAYVMFVLEHPGHAEVMFLDYPPETYPEASQAASDALDILEDLIKDGQEQNRVRTGDSRLWATVAWSMLHGVAVILASQKMPTEVMADLTPTALTRQFVDLFYDGMRPTD